MHAVSNNSLQAVMCVAELQPGAMISLVQRFGLGLVAVADGAPIPGSFWGEPEAGIIAATLYVRDDTPVHSALHELSHLVCMTDARRTTLARDAGGDDAEECAVCYLQVLLADELTDVGRERLMQDMDTWGYSFRLGSTRNWFDGDAVDAADWLRAEGLVDAGGQLCWRLRP